MLTRRIRRLPAPPSKPAPAADSGSDGAAAPPNLQITLSVTLTIEPPPHFPRRRDRRGLRLVRSTPAHWRPRPLRPEPVGRKAA
jgi:hypothetical protein